MCAKSLQSCPTLCDPMDCSLPSSSIHRVLQARILEWVTVPCSRGSSRPRDGTRVSYVSCIGRWLLYHQRHLRSLQIPGDFSKCMLLVTRVLSRINTEQMDHHCWSVPQWYSGHPPDFEEPLAPTCTYTLRACNHKFQEAGLHQASGMETFPPALVFRMPFLHTLSPTLAQSGTFYVTKLISKRAFWLIWYRRILKFYPK